MALLEKNSLKPALAAVNTSAAGLPRWLSWGAVLFAACLMAACSAQTYTSADPVAEADGPGQSLTDALGALNSTPPPPGSDRELYLELREQLSQVLKETGQTRFVSDAPTSDASQVDDLTVFSLGDGTAQCRWTYRNQADCDQNSEVNVSDLTPIGVHYGKTAADTDWLAASFADTDGNGLVSVTDITPLGQNYQNRVAGYYLQSSTRPDPLGTWDLVAEIPFAASTLTEPGVPRIFNHVLPTPEIGLFYRVVPFAGETTGNTGVPTEYTGEGEPVYQVSGSCRDLAGQPLAGVTVSLGSLEPVITGAAGTFVLAGLSTGFTDYLVADHPELSLEPTSRRIVIQAADITDIVFAASTIPVYALYIDPMYIAELDVELWDADYKPGAIVAEGTLFPDVGIRYRGGAAMTFPKKSWKVDFTGEQYDDPEWGYKRGKFNLNAEYTDTTLMREMLTYELLHDFNMLAPRARFAKVYVNDVYFGLFTDVENTRRNWLDEMGINRDGALYQANLSQMKVLPAVADYQLAFEKELLDAEPYDDLIEFIETLNGWTPAEVSDSFAQWVDVEQLQSYLVVYSLVSMADHIETNYMLYNDLAATGRWYIVPWDHDRTWGHRWDNDLGFFSLEIIDDTPVDYGSYHGDEEAWGNILYDRYLNDPDYWAQYQQALADALSNQFTEQRMLERIDANYNLIRDAALADPNKWGDNADYAQRVEDLREYVRLRRAFIQTALGG